MEPSNAYQRGSYGGRTLQNQYESLRHRLPNDGLADSDRVFRAYYLYLCRRKARLFRFTGAYGLDALVLYVCYAVDKLLDLLALKRGCRKEYARQAVVNVSLGHEHLCSGGSDSFLVGRKRLGVGTSLGTSSTEASPRADMWIELPLGAWQAIMAEEGSLLYLMEACDFAFPLNMSFRLCLAVREDDWSFVLGSGGTDARIGHRRSILGVTTGLGAVNVEET